MKCQNLFYGKNKKNIINLSSVKLAQRMIKVNVDFEEEIIRRGQKITG